MQFGILQRYVMGEVLRAFILALLTITAIFVLFVIMAEAARKGLAPIDIARLVPFVIPTTLPFTIPVSLLFAVTVVYGRIASDNEIVAIKSAGVGVLTVLNPAFTLGFALTITLLYLNNDAIPRASATATKIIFKNLEDYFYKVLKKEREFNNPNWPFQIKVKDVDGKNLIGATFKHRQPGAGNPNTFDLVVQAERAVVNFDLDRHVARVFLEHATIQRGGTNPDVVLIDEGKTLEMQLPGNDMQSDIKVQELTLGEISREQAKLRHNIANEQRRQAIAAALWFGSGRIDRVDRPSLQSSVHQYPYWEQKWNELETERWFRLAMASGSFFFVLLGAPVGILFARRDFLSAFISCFVPIILIYYPLTLFGVNMGKEGILPAWSVLLGNGVLGLLAGFFALPPVRQH